MQNCASRDTTIKNTLATANLPSQKSLEIIIHKHISPKQLKTLHFELKKNKQTSHPHFSKHIRRIKKYIKKNSFSSLQIQLKSRQNEMKLQCTQPHKEAKIGKLHRDPRSPCRTPSFSSATADDGGSGNPTTQWIMEKWEKRRKTYLG